MKSSFGRSFFTAAAILLVAMTILGASFQIKVNQFLTDTTVSGLQQNADTIAELAAAYFNNGGMYNRSFQLNLTVASQVSGADAVVCDSEGNVVLCSDAPSGCEHQGLQLNQAYLQKVIRSGGDTATGVINGLYSDRRYMVSRPILVDGNAGGIVLVSTPANDITQIMNKISNIFLTAALFVVLISVLAVTAFARRESRPLKELAKTANAFGHGDLEARVRLDDDYSEEMEEVAVAFNNMAASLQKSEYRRQEFVANVSHELRTPLTAIAGYAETLRDSAAEDPSICAKFAETILRNAQHMGTMVEDLLKLSRIESGAVPMEMETVKAASILSDVTTACQPQTAAHNLTLETDIDPALTVRADPHFIGQVFRNLIENACRYAPEGSTIKVSGGKRLDHNGLPEALFMICDDGPGIPQADIARVFERFYRVEKHRSSPASTGLGLAICKHIVERHGGRIWAEPGPGGCLQFTLPLAAETEKRT